MKNRTSVRFWIINVGFRVLACLAIFISTSLFNPGFCQNLRYSFKQGEIIDYDLIEETTRGNGTYTQSVQKIWKYQFTVESVNSSVFKIIMKLLGVSQKDSAPLQNNTTNKVQTSTFNQKSNVFSAFTDVEIKHPISFTMDSRGQILKISGVDSLFNEVFRQRLPSTGSDIGVSYDQILVRYSKEYYSWIIHEFFPAIRESLQPESQMEVIFLKSGIRTVTRVNIWNIAFMEQNDSIAMELQRTHLFEPKTSPLLDLDQTNKMLITWSQHFGYPTHIEYTGFLPEDLALFVSDKQDLFSLGAARHVQITNTKRSQNQGTPVQILGSLSNFENKEITAYYPGGEISKKRIPIFIGKDGKFSISFNLDIQGCIVNFVIGRLGQDFSARPDNQNQIRVFVKPGDSVQFSADLSNMETLKFHGLSQKEQVLLNSLSTDYSPQYPEKSLQAINYNLKLIRQQKYLLDTVFVKHLEREQQYTSLAYQLTEMARPSSLTRATLKPQSIFKFAKYLGCPDGYLSDAYKDFLCQYVDNYYNATTSSRFQGIPSATIFEVAKTILRGWDLYWYLAKLSEDELKGFLFSNSAKYYNRFLDLYPGTEYRIQLFNQHQKIQKGKPGTQIPIILFEDAKGKTHSTNDFLGEYWFILNLDNSARMSKFFQNNTDSLINLIPDHLSVIISSPASDQEELKTCESRFHGKRIMILPSTPKNKEILDYLNDLPKMIIGINTSNLIATYDQFGMFEFGSLATWAYRNSLTSKNINPTFLWYSLGGIVVGAIVIILLIRVRSKRNENRLVLKRKIAQLEVDAVRSRMNPHFLFNALSSIQNLINEKQIEQANQFLSQFGDLVRTILDQSSKSTIGLNEELDMIRNYLEIEQLRFPFEFDIQIDPTIDVYGIEIPPLLIQPHVENAVIHGVSGLGKGGRIIISFRIEDNLLICEVKDNGPGYHPETNQRKGGLGQGWKLTRQRIQLMKEQYGDEISVEVLNLADGSDNENDLAGTVVRFKLPIQKPTL